MRLSPLTAVVALVLAGCAGTFGGPTNEPVKNAPTGAPLDAVTLGNGTIVERDATSVTVRWNGTLQETVVLPTTKRVFLGPETRTTLVVPNATFFALDVRATSDAGRVHVFVRNAIEQVCSLTAADFASCVAFSRADDPALASWTVQLLADDSNSPAKPFTFEARVRVVEAAGGGLAPLLPPRDGANLRFAPAVSVAPDVGMHEPSVVVDGRGTIFVAGYSDLAGTLWRSTDGGASFTPVRVADAPYCRGPAQVPSAPSPLTPEGEYSHAGCGDVALATSGTSDVYFSHHWSGEAVHASHDGGATWTTQLVASGEPALTDRQWLAADGQRAWLVFNSGLRSPASLAVGRTAVSRTTDGGATWAEVGAIPDAKCIPGGLAYAKAKAKLLLSTCSTEGPAVAVSSDDGLTWSWHLVAPRAGPAEGRLCYACALVTAIDVDDEGNAYVAWSDPSSGQFDVWLASSRDGGSSWSRPIRVTTAPGTHVMPWIAAGAPGHVVVAYYATAQVAQPGKADRAAWFAQLAESFDGLSDAPTFDEALVSATPVQYGPVCLGGASSCPTDRNLGDLLSVDLAPDERPVVAFSDGRAGGDWTGFTRVMVARVS